MLSINITFWVILIAFLVGANCSLIGSFLVLRKEVMLSDAISHTVLLGIVLVFLSTNSMHPIVLLIGAIVTGFLTTLLISFFLYQVHIPTDVAMGITFTSLFSLGVVLISLYTNKVDLDLECVLYGQLQMAPFDVWIYNGLNIGPKAVYLLSILLLFNTLLVVLCYPMLFITSFDPTFASSLGVNTKLWHHILMVATSITTVMASKVVGAVLVVGFFVIPPTTAYLLTNSLPIMLLLALCINIVVAFGGYQVAVILNSSVAGAIIAFATFLFCLAFCIYKYHSYRIT